MQLHPVTSHVIGPYDVPSTVVLCHINESLRTKLYDNQTFHMYSIVFEAPMIIQFAMDSIKLKYNKK
jgi:hypothetical protein